MFFKKKVKEEVILNNGDNHLNTNSSVFSQSKITVNGNQNAVDFSDCNIDNTYLTIKGDGNEIIVKQTRLNNSTINISGNNNVITFEQGSLIASMEIVIYGNDHHLIIGESVEVYGKLSFWFEDNDNKIIIGNYTTFGIANIAIAEPNTEILIGKDCMFANNVSIKNSDFHSIIDLNTNTRINPSKNIYIGEHVWLGENCHVLKNVTINDNSVVALGTVVTKDVPANCIVAGNPNKVIKENISWTRERTI